MYTLYHDDLSSFQRPLQDAINRKNMTNLQISPEV